MKNEEKYHEKKLENDIFLNLLSRCAFLQQVYDELFNNENNNDDQSRIALETIDTMTKLFTNFAKTG